MRENEAGEREEEREGESKGEREGEREMKGAGEREGERSGWRVYHGRRERQLVERGRVGGKTEKS